MDAVVNRLQGARPAPASPPSPTAPRKSLASADYVPTYAKRHHDTAGKGRKGVELGRIVWPPSRIFRRGCPSGLRMRPHVLKLRAILPTHVV